MKKILNNDYVKSILIYTFIFVFLSLILYCTFRLNGKTIIWNEDGIFQHVVNLKSFRELLINSIKTNTFNTFTWKSGLGMDLYSNYAYYILGDPFSYLSILVPAKKVFSLYTFLVILRLYFVGISFIIYAKRKKFNSFSTIIGATMYAFCSFALFSATRHPYFINELILLPLILLATERLILYDKPFFYSIILCITFIVSFYFAYMFCFIIAIYSIILIIYNYKKDVIKKIINKFIKLFIYSLLGILLSSIILIPTFISFINTERISYNTVYPYTLLYYRKLLSTMLTISSNSNWVCIGVSSIIFITLPLFFKEKKKETPIKIFLLILIIPLLISQVSSIMCGFGFPNNRWSFTFSFIFSIITSYILNKKELLNEKCIKYSIISIGIVLLSNVIFDIKITNNMLIQIITLLSLILVISYKDKLKKYNMFNILFTIIFVLGIGFNIYYEYSPSGNSFSENYIDRKNINQILNTSYYQMNDFDKSIKYITDSDKEYYRIMKHPFAHENLSIISNYNSISSYYSLTPQVYNDITNDLMNIDHYTSLGLKEFNYRTRITSLLGSKYLVSNSGKMVPYGYESIKEYKSGTKIYKNNNSLNFAILYTDTISIEDYDKLSPLEKEITLLKKSATEDNKGANNKIDYSKYIKQIDYKIIDNNRIKIKDKNIFKINNINTSIDLKINKQDNCELYILFKNIRFNPLSKNEYIKLYNKKLNKETNINNYKVNNRMNYNEAKNKYKWYEKDYRYTLGVTYNDNTIERSIQDYRTSAYYIDINDFLFNLGYQDKFKDTITITLNNYGTYTYDDIIIYSVNMKDYEEDIDRLNKSNYKLIEHKDNYMHGTVDIKKDGILQFSTLYNDGFKVFVDNKEVKTFKSNKYFLGINIKEGKHDIIIKYKTPYIKEGSIISLISLVILIILYFIKNIKNNTLKNNIFFKLYKYGLNIYHKNEEIWNYLIVGGLTTIVSLGTYYLSVLLFLNPSKPLQLQSANIISWICAVIFAYITNRKFVFKSKEKNIKKEASSFIGSRVITLLIDMLTMFLLVSIMSFNDKIAKLLAQIIVVIVNYIISKLFVFKKDN